MEADVFIAGGGSAGLAAAVTAAREGASVVLAERAGCLGGMGTQSLVHSFCGLYPIPAPGSNPDPNPPYANPGMASEIADRMKAAGAACGPYRMGKVDVLLQNPTGFMEVADAIVAETPGIVLRLHSEIIAAERDPYSGKIRGATLCCRGRIEQVEFRAAIDATAPPLTPPHRRPGSGGAKSNFLAIITSICHHNRLGRCGCLDNVLVASATVTAK